MTIERLFEEGRQALGRVVVGHDEAIDAMLAALVLESHVLIEGPPGTAKTLLVRTLARAAGLDFARIQFTPDLMPADLTGTMIFRPNDGTFELRKGPVFASIVLADEINRTPPKTQAALLEAMQERAVTIDGETYKLPDHFMVIATQNPIEQQGVYPLPEAQLDRFLFKHRVSYPSVEEETKIVARHGARFGAPRPEDWGIEPNVSAPRLTEAIAFVAQIPMVEEVVNYVVALVRATREAPDLEAGASPRAAAMLAGAARARAALDGRDNVLPDDVKALALPVLRHRVVPTFNAEAEGISVDDIITRLLKAVPRGEAKRSL